MPCRVTHRHLCGPQHASQLDKLTQKANLEYVVLRTALSANRTLVRCEAEVMFEPIVTTFRASLLK